MYDIYCILQVLTYSVEFIKKNFEKDDIRLTIIEGFREHTNAYKHSGSPMSGNQD